MDLSTGAAPLIRLDPAPPPLATVRGDAAQQAALALIAQGGPVTVFGAPGTGKTLLAELAAAQALQSGRRVVVLTPERHIAQSLASRIVRRARLTLERRVAVTPAALAMSVLEARAAAIAAQPWDGATEAARAFQPQMVTGAEQLAAFSELLAMDAATGLVGVTWPASIPPAARVLPAFRSELRDLLMRAAERGLDAVALAQLGQAHGHAEWVAAAQFYQAYLDSLDVGGAADSGLKLDVAAMVATAHACLRDWSYPFSVAGRSVQLDSSLRPAWDLVIVDDYQEASLALHRLVGELGAGGAQLVVLGSPESAVQTYRGALPSLVALTLSDPVGGGADLPDAVRYGVASAAGGGAAAYGADLDDAVRGVGAAAAGRGAAAYGADLDDAVRYGVAGAAGGGAADEPAGGLACGWSARPAVLGTGWRAGGTLAARTQAIRLRVRSPGAPREARLAPESVPTDAVPPPAKPGDRTLTSGDTAANQAAPAAGNPATGLGAVLTATAASAAGAAGLIARYLRQAHIARSVPWDQMAVLVRTGGQVAQLRSSLTGAGVPVHVPGSEVLSTDQAAVAPLIQAMRSAAEPAALTPQVAVTLLTSVIGGLDAAELRVLRRALVRAAAHRGLEATSDELLVGVLSGAPPGPDPTRAPGADGALNPASGAAAAEQSLGEPRAGGLAAEPALPDGAWPVRRLVDWTGLLDAAREDGLAPGIADRVNRLARALAAGRAEADTGGAPSGMVLWAVWDGIGLGETWQEMALRGGPAGVRADSDLDAVLALFAAANRHDARRPGSGVGGFLDYLAAQEVPSDTIAPHAPRVGKVTVSTVAGAVGHEWDVVALAGLEEGVWPDLRLRDTLLGAGQLADLVSAGLTALDPVERRRAVAEDETRLLVLAATRARRELLAVAVDNDEDQPSRFFEWLAGGPPDAGGGDAGAGAVGLAGGPPDAGGLAAGLVGGLTAGLGGGGDALIGGWQVPFDLRGVVAAARARLVPAKAPPGSLAERDPVTGLDEQRPAVPDASAAAVLAILAALGVDGADPAVWPGLLPQSTDAPLFPAEREPTLSPSALERLADCPLSWALGRVGGTVAVGAAANLGTLIHSLAEEFGTPEQLSQYPRLDGLKGELTRRLEERWSELGLEDNYTNRGLALRARNMVQNLASYLDGCRDLAYVAVEARFGWGPNRPGERAGEQPGEQSGTRSGKQSGEQAGAGPGAELGAGPGAELGAGLGAQPGEPRRGLPVALRGKVDRIERDATGATQVVDFKTGASVPTAQSAKRNPQLGAYQAALAAGLVEGFAPTEADGAKLVYLDHVVRGQVKQLHQSALNSAEPWLDQFLADCRTTVGRSWFEAHPSPRTCANCAVIGSCPALNQGKQVTP